MRFNPDYNLCLCVMCDDVCFCVAPGQATYCDECEDAEARSLDESGLPVYSMTCHPDEEVTDA